MRFPRQAKLFRGPLDPAPVAGVFFLLVIFLLLRSMVYTPGVLVETGAAQVITVSREGQITFNGRNYTSDDVDQLRQDLKSLDPASSVSVQSDPNAPAELVRQVRELMRIELPKADGLLGTENPTVMVAVNMRGQLFYESRMISEEQLRVELRNCLKAAGTQAKHLTLVLLEDGAVESKVFVRLCALAREVGLQKVLISARPNVFSVPATSTPK